MSFSEETKARKKRKGHRASRYYESFLEDTGTAESLSWIKDIKVRPKDRLRKTYYVKLRGDSKFQDDEKGLMLHAIEFLIDTFGSTAGVKMFAYPDQGRCCFYLAKYELKVVKAIFTSTSSWKKYQKSSLFCYPNQGQNGQLRKKKAEDERFREYKAEDGRVLSVERAPNNAVASVEKAPDSANLEQSRN